MPVIRSYRYVLRSITPAVCRIAPNRTACGRLRSYSAVGRDRHSCVLGCRVVIRLCWFTSGLRVFFGGDPDGIIGAAGLRNWRRGLCAFLRSRIGIVSFSAGRTLGLRAPDCAKESSTLWTLFTLRRGCLAADSRLLCAFAQAHWLCNAFRGEYAGATRPRLRQGDSSPWTLFI